MTHAYTLADEEFAFLACKFGEVLTNRVNPDTKISKPIPYVVIGSVATQAQVLDRMCRHYNRNIVTLPSVKEIGETQDYLRATDTLDIALRFKDIYDKLNNAPDEFTLQEAHGASAREIEDVCREVVKGLDGDGWYFSGSQEQLFHYRLERAGARKIRFGVTVGKYTRTEPIEVRISRWAGDMIGEKGLGGLRPNLYNRFIARGEELNIPYNNGFGLHLRVLNPIDLLIVKIARSSHRDDMDAGVLVDAMRMVGEFDKSKEFYKINRDLNRYLVPVYEDNLRRFAGLFDVPITIVHKEEKDSEQRKQPGKKKK